MLKVVADTWACPRAGRALGPGRRTCWRVPCPARLRWEHRAAEREARAHAEDTDARGCGSEERGRGSPWPSCCGACGIHSSWRASSAAAGSSRRRRSVLGRRARAFQSGRQGSPRSLISPTTWVRCLPWGAGRRPPAYLRLRLWVTPRWGWEDSIRRHPASTLRRERWGTVTRCHPLCRW